MQKIQFEDAVLQEQAYVTIDDVDYPVVESTYTGGTDLNAQTLNTMQDNIETAINDGVNGVINSGSNTNGNYTKFADGTLICWGTKNFTNVSSYSGSDQTVTLPFNFVNNTYCIQFSKSAGGSYWAETTAQSNAKTTSSFRLELYNMGGGTLPTINICWLAIGKWK